MSKHTMESLAFLGRRLRRSTGGDQSTFSHKAVTLNLQPKLRDRLDGAYYKPKAGGSRISRPDFREAIIEAGLNQFDAALNDVKVSSTQPMIPARNTAAEDGLAAVTAGD